VRGSCDSCLGALFERAVHLLESDPRAHGMTILELDNRFPPDADLEATWQRGLDALRP
jgi:hypothetical protein